MNKCLKFRINCNIYALHRKIIVKSHKNGEETEKSLYVFRLPNCAKRNACIIFWLYYNKGGSYDPAKKRSP